MGSAAKRWRLLAGFGGIWLVAMLPPVPGGGAWAQSPGGMSGSGGGTGAAGAQMNEMESRALVQVGRQGGSLMPKDTVAGCEDGSAQVGKTKEKDFVKVPSSLLNELKEREAASTVVIGNVYSLGCK